MTLGMTHGVLRRWLVKDGDRVAVGQLLFELETDDGILEIGSFDPGVVTTTPVEGERLPVGAVIGTITCSAEEKAELDAFLDRKSYERFLKRELDAKDEIH